MPRASSASRNWIRTKRRWILRKRSCSALEAQVRQETVQLHYYRVTASTSGIVGDIPVRVGDRVTTSTVLTTVDKPGKS